MADARDAEDTQWLEEGDAGLARLLAKYEPVILGRCMARLKGADAAFDVAQTVMLRLVDEFRRGKRYPVPYRVVVHQVIGWTLNDHFGVKNRRSRSTRPGTRGADDAELAAIARAPRPDARVRRPARAPAAGVRAALPEPASSPTRSRRSSA